MAHIEDRWWRKDTRPDGSAEWVKLDRYGKGRRWLLRWREADGRDRKLSFDRKVDAESKEVEVRDQLRRGTYLDPQAGRETFGAYLTRWLSTVNSDPATIEGMANRIRLYVEPHTLYRTRMNAIRPSAVQAWLRYLVERGLAASTVRVTFMHVQTALSAAVDDGLISKNPCRASSVSPPKIADRKVVPWPHEWVSGMREALSDRYAVVVTLGTGLGLRQGEIFGLSPEDVDWLRGWVTVRRQVKFVNNRTVFAMPKGGKIREVPLPEMVKHELAAYLARFPAREVVLPWETPSSSTSATVPLMVTTAQGGALKRPTFNQWSWSPARVRVGVPAVRANGMHALRHYYASVLLDGGESIKAVSEYLGHSSAAFTLKTYTHLMPSSENRTRAAVDAAMRSSSCAPHAPHADTAGS